MTVYYVVKKGDLYFSHELAVMFTEHLHRAFIYNRKDAADECAKQLNGEVVPVRLEIIDNPTIVEAQTSFIQPTDQEDGC